MAYFDLTRFPKQKVKKFSLGMKQKLGIAQAFLGAYPLIVLDEPTNALDHEFVNKVATQKLYVQEGTINHEK